MIVIGAGISGLFAGRALVAAGLRVVVLEARPRVGGRLLSHRRAPGALDLGATWYWSGESRVEALVEELKVPTFDQFTDGDALFQVPGSVQRIDGNPIDVPARRFALGAQQLAESLAEALPDDAVRMETTVTQVRAGGETCVVETSRTPLSAPYVVLALPPALAISRIEFVPRLPEEVLRLASLTPVWMGGVTKVVARYGSAFWRARGLAGAAISHVGPMREVHDMSGPGGDPATLFGFVPAVEVGGPTIGSDQVLEQMGLLYGADALHPEELWIHDWRREPLTSPPEVERLQHYETFGHRLYTLPLCGGRIHWASTETAATSPGHIEGALAAAERAVASILGAKLRG